MGALATAPAESVAVNVLSQCGLDRLIAFGREFSYHIGTGPHEVSSRYSQSRLGRECLRASRVELVKV